MFTVRDIVNFILEHRKQTKAFAGWSPNDLAIAFANGSTLGEASWTARNGQLTGVVLIRRDDAKKVIHVVGILTIEPLALGLLYKKYLALYPNYSLTANRHGKSKIYNVEKLTKRLCNLN